MALIAACVSFVITLLYFKRRLAIIMNKSVNGLSNNLYMYILGTLLNQGQYYNNNNSNHIHWWI